MTEAQKQAHKEILWKTRTGQGRTVISWQERPSKSAVEQSRGANWEYGYAQGAGKKIMEG